eukprot:scaffold201_cov405-Prasinococcus_capsulatus_cf.AAC.10
MARCRADALPACAEQGGPSMWWRGRGFRAERVPGSTRSQSIVLKARAPATLALRDGSRAPFATHKSRRHQRTSTSALPSDLHKEKSDSQTEATIVVVGLGPGAPGQITREAWEVLTSASTVYCRTLDHPTLDELPTRAPLQSFDHVYESSKSFEDVYKQICLELVELASSAEKGHHIVYAVPGDPRVAEQSVALLYEEAKRRQISLRIIPGLSFIEPTLEALGIDAFPSLALADACEYAARSHPRFSTDVPVLLAQFYSQRLASGVKLTLMDAFPDDWPVTIVHNAGTANCVISRDVPLYAIDRELEHPLGPHSSLYVPALTASASFENVRNAISIQRDRVQGIFETERTTEEALADVARSLKECVTRLRALYSMDSTDDGLQEASDRDELLSAQGNRSVEDPLANLLLKALEAMHIAEDNGDADLTRILQRMNLTADARVKEFDSENEAAVLVDMEDMLISEQDLFDDDGEGTDVEEFSPDGLNNLRK